MKAPGNELLFLPSPPLEKIEKKVATVRFTRKTFESVLKNRSKTS